jgi:hypothetical protein
VVEPYQWKVGVKRLGKNGQKLQNCSTHMMDSKICPKISVSVRGSRKLMGEFRSKARSEINASSISPSPPSEIEILLEGISEIMLNIVHNETKDEERTKTLTIRNQATATWTKNRDEMTTSEEEEDINASIENQGKKKSRRRRKRK